MEKFDVPIVLFIFKRLETTLRILEIIKSIKPTCLYIVSDQGRNETEVEIVDRVRFNVKNYLRDWETNVVYEFAETNKGVYENIGLGACNIFEKEEMAIFLEDDNLPSISFFYFCKELLNKYKENENVFWICGTNYLGEYKPSDNASFVFTQQLLPCGWASWSTKFVRYYSKNFDNLNANDLKMIKKKYINKKLFEQQKTNWLSEKGRNAKGKKYFSWDYHMSYTLMENDLYGISPNKNLIENIGVDENSEHGGSSYVDVMTKRFCSIPNYELDFPLRYPSSIKIDDRYEKLISKIILLPLSKRFKIHSVKLVKFVLRIPIDMRFRDVKERVKKWILH